MWLMKGLAPDHNTIANFRKDNPKAIRKIFHATVSLAINFDLIGAKLLAGDGTKLRAQNSKKNNFTHAKIERHIAYIDQKLDEYSIILAQQDGDIIPEQKAEIKQRIEKHQQHKNRYQGFKEHLDQTGQRQGLVRRRQGMHVEPLAGRGRPPVEGVAVPGRHPDLLVIRLFLGRVPAPAHLIGPHRPRHDRRRILDDGRVVLAAPGDRIGLPRGVEVARSDAVALYREESRAAMAAAKIGSSSWK